jgi:hypothetical protein
MVVEGLMVDHGVLSEVLNLIELWSRFPENIWAIAVRGNSHIRPFSEVCRVSRVAGEVSSYSVLIDAPRFERS